MCSTKPCFFSVSFAMMRHSFLRADTKNRFPCSRPWPEPCAGTKGAFAVPPGLKRFQRVGKARLRRSFPTVLKKCLRPRAQTPRPPGKAGRYDCTLEGCGPPNLPVGGEGGGTRFHLCLRRISGAGRRGLAEGAQRRGRAGVRDRPRSRGGGSLGTGQGGARFSRVSGAGPGTGVFYHRRPGFATGK